MRSVEHAPTRAEDCQEMDEVRCEIDRLDRELVRLIAERPTTVEHSLAYCTA